MLFRSAEQADGDYLSAEASFTIEDNGLQAYDRITLWYLNFAFDYIVPVVSPLPTAAQIAASLLLLTAASTLLQDLLTAKRRPLGFQPDRVLALQFDFPWDTDSEKLVRFYKDAEESLKQIPGVRAAGLIDRLPLEGGTQSRNFLRIRGQDLDRSLYDSKRKPDQLLPAGRYTAKNRCNSAWSECRFLLYRNYRCTGHY